MQVQKGAFCGLHNKPKSVFGPRWESSQRSPDPLVCWGKDTPPHTPLHLVPTNLRRLPCVPLRSPARSTPMSIVVVPRTCTVSVADLTCFLVEGQHTPFPYSSSPSSLSLPYSRPFSLLISCNQPGGLGSAVSSIQWRHWRRTAPGGTIQGGGDTRMKKKLWLNLEEKTMEKRRWRAGVWDVS